METTFKFTNTGTKSVLTCTSSLMPALTGSAAIIAYLLLDNANTIIPWHVVSEITHSQKEHDYFVQRSLDVQYHKAKKYLTELGHVVIRHRGEGIQLLCTEKITFS